MTDSKKAAKKPERDTPQIPFDEALKRVWSAPPQHKVVKEKPKKK